MSLVIQQGTTAADTVSYVAPEHLLCPTKRGPCRAMALETQHFHMPKVISCLIFHSMSMLPEHILAQADIYVHVT